MLKTAFIAIFIYALLCSRLLAATPNVVLIVADDLGWGDVQYRQDRAVGDPFEGNRVLRTPNLAAMAESGLRFHRFYAASPVCSPTRASLLTGRHGARHGIDGALMPGDEGKIRNRELTIAELAQTQGYRTGHFGKWHVGSLTKHTYDMRRGRVGNFRDYSPPWANGYDVAFASENWMPTYDPYDVFPHNKVAQAAYFTGPSDAALTHRVPNDARVDNRHESEIVADEAIDFIEQSHGRGRPFLTTIWFATPHIPLMETPDASYDRRGLSSERRRYFEAVTKMDEQIGRIRRTLADLRIAEETLVVFTSDNGPQRRNVGSTGGLRGQKATLWEGGLRVPGIVEWRGHIDPGVGAHAPATTNDLLPTLLDLWGISMPDDRPLDGVSLCPIFEQGDQERPTGYRFYSVFAHQQMAMDNRYKLISRDGGGRYRLYDLLRDPAERNDLLAGSPPAARSPASLPPASLRRKRDELISGLQRWIASCERSAAGNDFQTRIASAENVVVRPDVIESLSLTPIGEDSFGAPVYEDGYEITEGAFENSHEASLFLERQYATLSNSLAVDSEGQPGAFNEDHSPQEGVLPAGEVCHSFLVHFDPLDEEADADDDSTVEAKITFGDPIAGVMARSEHLDASDFLAFAEPRFHADDAHDASDRGALFGADSGDGWTIAGDGRTIRINLTAGAGEIDQLRILTAATIPVSDDPRANAAVKMDLSNSK